MNYRKLLEKYMNLVGEQEGTYFLMWAREPIFTEEELDELEEIVAEIQSERQP